MEIIHLSLLITLCVGVHWSSSEILRRQKRWLIDSFTIEESYNGHYPYSLGHVKVEEEIVLFRIHGQGVDEEPRNVLKIIEDTGELWVLGPVDYEKYQSLRLTFQAIDKKRDVISTQLSIIVQIRDADDCPPTFDRIRYDVSVKESTSQGSELITVRATDKDLTDIFRKFDLRIVSVSPQPEEVEFYLTQFPDEIGTISFKGCLDHEQAASYTIIVEAKEQGQKRLSSSCTIVLNIEDQNNHLPVITQHKAVVRVQEDEENILVLRVPVTDEDEKDTLSWRVKYHFEEEDNNFKITTDSKTNEGLLYLSKSLDYEKTPVKNITIIAENEIPYHTCKVLDRSASGLWKVAFTSYTVGKQPAPPQTRQEVTVIVENINEAPVFDMAHQKVRVMENAEVGTYLKTFSAKDPDVNSADNIVYKTGKDPAGWVTVDAKTGKVTTTEIIDRESSFVNNSVYVVTIHAADDGKPPRTGTATLSILISDKNDNTPFLVSNTIDLCQSNKRSMTRIEASDLDEEPNGGPFNFRLLGDVQDKWKLDRSNGFSVNLVKENTVHSGHHDLKIVLTDLQGSTAVHDLSVTVCNCIDSTKPNCNQRKSAVASAGGATVGIILLSLLLFAGLFLLALLFTCKPDKIPLQDEGFGNLMTSNIEAQGTDCEVTFDRDPKWTQIQTTSQVKTAAANTMYKNGMQSSVSQTQPLLKQPKDAQWLDNMVPNGEFFEGSTRHTQFQRQRPHFENSMHMSMDASSMSELQQMRLQRTLSTNKGWPDQLKIQEMMLKNELHKHETQSSKLDDYKPHVYAEEGDSQHNFELDAISMSEVDFDPNLELDFKFSPLASICKRTGKTVYSTQASD